MAYRILSLPSASRGGSPHAFRWDLKLYVRCFRARCAAFPPTVVVDRTGKASPTQGDPAPGVAGALRLLLSRTAPPAPGSGGSLRVTLWGSGDPAPPVWIRLGTDPASLHRASRRLIRAISAIGAKDGSPVMVQLLPSASHPVVVCVTRDPLTGVRIPACVRATTADAYTVEATVGSLRGHAPKGISRLCAAVERVIGQVAELDVLCAPGGPVLLGIRSAQLAAPAALRVALGSVRDGVWPRERAVASFSTCHLEALLRPVPRKGACERLGSIGSGQGVSPGVVSGRAFVSLAAARNAKTAGHRTVLFAADLTRAELEAGGHPDAVVLIGGGLCTAAASWARKEAVPMVAGLAGLVIERDRAEVGDLTCPEGTWVTVDGGSGRVYMGEPRLQRRPPSAGIRRLLSWADETRQTRGPRILANADDAQGARVGMTQGAAGIGLCRTERMLGGSDRAGLLFAYASAPRGSARRERQALVRGYHTEFLALIRVCAGSPLTVRLLDPSLDDLPPMGSDGQRLRGCRVGVLWPDIYDVQVEALIRAAYGYRRAGGQTRTRVLLPQVNTAAEIQVLRTRVLEIRDRVAGQEGWVLPLPVGAMIETPRAAMVAGALARVADFLCFGTNDLTQYTLGLMREGRAATLGSGTPDPFRYLDADSVLALMRRAVFQARRSHPGVDIGVCGEHAGEPVSVARMLDGCLSLNYLSCQPARLPVARLVAAQMSLSLTHARPRG